MNRRASFLLSSSVLIPGPPATIRLSKTGPGWSHNSNAIQRCKGPPCLRCSVSNTQVAIDRPKSGPCNDILPDGVPCMGRSKKSSLNNDTSPESEPNPMRTHMEDLGVTIAGDPFPHMVYHFVLTYSNVEA